MTRLIATWFYTGLLPFVPGTWGSAAALPFAVILHKAGGFPILLIATIAVFSLGWWATAEETRGKAEHDPGEIVIDEVVGMWITLLPMSFAFWFYRIEVDMLPWPGLVSGFVLFRFFDIWKPWPVRWADQKSTPFGVMFDDVLAGIYAAISSLALAGIFHQIIQ
ncbi:MAG: phosphatidylglycerophosphatase A [Rhodobacteraceae bacterium]|nr:phosphatidylglycerophosphatase A [Paracoccaceae bacterium]